MVILFNFWGENMVSIYTPGHSLYTDSLIMYAIVYSLRNFFNEKFDFNEDFVAVNSIGSGFRIDVKDLEYVDIAEAISNVLIEEKSAIISYLSTTTEEAPSIGLFKDKDLKVLDCLTNSREVLNYLSRELATPGHALKEGREGKGITFKLPTMPYAGKYLHADITKFRKYPAKSYKTCKYCLSLALFGLKVSSMVLRWSRSRFINIFSFDGEVNSEYFRAFFEYIKSEEYKDVIRTYGKAVEDIPMRNLAYFLVLEAGSDLLSIMKSMCARWITCSVLFEISRGVPQIRGYQENDVSSIVENSVKMFELITSPIEIIRLIGNLVRRGEAEALDHFFNFLRSPNLNHLYNFVRESYVSRSETLISSSIVWNLIKLVI